MGHRHADRLARVVFFLVALLAATRATEAGRIGLRWDASPGATGYRVWWGPSPGVYSSTRAVGNVLQTTIDGLSDCQTWHFAVSAYNTVGESAVSDEIATWPRPTIAGVSPGQVLQGEQVTLVLSGASLEPGSTIVAEHSGLILGDPSISCDEIRVPAAVAPAAEGERPALAGVAELVVRGPGGLSASTVERFEILVDPSRFDVNRSDAVTSGRLDGRDLVWLARRFGAREPSSEYDPNYDFDGDGWIDGADISLLGTGFGKCWNGFAWTAAACPY